MYTIPLLPSLTVIAGVVTLIAAVQKWDFLFKEEKSLSFLKTRKKSELQTLYIICGLMIITAGLIFLIKI